jgi:hypothetical protein
MSTTYTDDLYDDQDHWPPCSDESCPWCYPQSPETDEEFKEEISEAMEEAAS